MTDNRQPTADELNGVKQDTVQWSAAAHRVTQVNSKGDPNSFDDPFFVNDSKNSKKIDLFENILIELKITNRHLESLTDEKINSRDIE